MGHVDPVFETQLRERRGNQMASVDKKFASWIQAELIKNRPIDKPLKRFVLRTAAPGSKGMEIQSFDLDEGIMIDDAAQFAEQVLQRAQDDADGNGPVLQRYCIYAFVKGANTPSGRFIFRLKGEADLDLDDESGEEAPTSKGLLSQLMRHNEVMTRLATQSATALTNVMVRQMEATNRTNEHLLEERTKMFRSLEEAKSDEHGRNMELLLTEGESNRKDQMFQKLMGLVPLVMNKMLGAKLLPDKNDPLMMLLEPFIGSMTSEQFQAIQQTLNPEQTMMFVELLQAFQKKKEQASKEN